MITEGSLSVLLSQVLIAFAIEFDNEFELQMSKTYARPFLTSIVMWSNFMRYVSADGTPVGEIARRSCAAVKNVASVVGGMERWGYIVVDHDPANGIPPRRKGFGSASGVKSASVIRPSMVGALAVERWSPLASEIEDRWRSRLGADAVDDLRSALRGVDARTDDALPRFLPIVSGLMFTEIERTGDAKEPDDDLPALLSRVLLVLTREVEHGAPVSLPLGANVLRVLGDAPTPIKDLPSLTGVSKEAVAMSMTPLHKLGYVEVASSPAGSGKAAILSEAGAAARADLRKRLDDAENGWGRRFGTDVVATLRRSLQTILDRPGGEDGDLTSGLVTPPGGWRATRRYAPLTAAFVRNPRAGLPFHAMVLHRGGWPDGS